MEEVAIAQRIVALEATVGTMLTTLEGLKKMLEGATIAGGGPLLRGITERVAALEEGTHGRVSPALSATFGGTNGKEWDDIVPR